jgi:very-short-patch-repair endonuclease
MPSIQSFNKTRQRAKELRQQLTPAEKLLWNRLRSRRLGGFKFRRQHPIGPYIADFYCAEHRLVVEVDGSIHFGQQEADEQRSQRMADYGYRVLRVSNQAVETDLESVMCTILESCQEGAESPLPGSGEGQGLSSRQEPHPKNAESPLPGSGEGQGLSSRQEPHPKNAESPLPGSGEGQG